MEALEMVEHTVRLLGNRPACRAGKTRVLRWLYHRCVSTLVTSKPVRSAAAVIAAVHVAILGVWIGVLGASAFTAAIAFPAMKELAPVLPEYPGLEVHHWSIAGGKIANPVLSAAIWGQVLLAALSAASFLSGRWRREPFLRFTHAAALLVACGAAVFHAGMIQPRMQREVSAYWSAAREGRTEEALAHKRAFDADHPLASRMIGLTLVTVAIAAGSACLRARPETQT